MQSYITTNIVENRFQMKKVYLLVIKPILLILITTEYLDYNIFFYFM